jgi:hypothetical protein
MVKIMKEEVITKVVSSTVRSYSHGTLVELALFVPFVVSTEVDVRIAMTTTTMKAIDDFRNRKSHAHHCWSAVVVQQYNYIVYNLAVVVQ